MEPADSRKCDDLPVSAGLDDSGDRRVFLESKMRTVHVKIADVGRDHPAELSLVERDYVVEAVAP